MSWTNFRDLVTSKEQRVREGSEPGPGRHLGARSLLGAEAHWPEAYPDLGSSSGPRQSLLGAPFLMLRPVTDPLSLPLFSCVRLMSVEMPLLCTQIQLAKDPGVQE